MEVGKCAETPGMFAWMCDVFEEKRGGEKRREQRRGDVRAVG